MMLHVSLWAEIYLKRDRRPKSHSDAAVGKFTMTARPRYSVLTWDDWLDVDGSRTKSREFAGCRVAWQEGGAGQSRDTRVKGWWLMS